MKNIYFNLSLLFVLLFISAGSAQVVLNEVSTANGSTIPDGLGHYEDWIELYNAGTSPVNLQDYAITNDANTPRKWVFPSVNIQAHGYLVLYASGRDVTVNGKIHTNFKLKADSRIMLRDANNNIIDDYTLTTPLQPDHSTGRTTDNASAWSFFNTPTPGLSNNNAIPYPGYEPDPVFSIGGGFYSSGQMVAISTSSSSGVIRFMTNGNEPVASSPVYGAPLVIGSTGVITARTFSTSGNLPSNVVQSTYFISETDLDLPVFSITTDSINLWSQDSGIYVAGANADTAFPHYGANYWQDWERGCVVEFFDANKVRQFETAAGLKIFGGYSRTFDQKGLKVKFRHRYGDASVHYQFINEKPFLDKYRDLILRNGGSDCLGTRFRDALMQRLVKGPTMDIMAYAPALVFLNGQFWGEYEIREKQDPDYIERNYNISSDKIDFLSHEGMLLVQAGSDTGFVHMYNYLTSANPADPSFYTNAGRMLDLDNYADYFISETYYGNKDWLGDWVNNIRLWRPQAPGGKWRYMLWDLDWGYGLYSNANTDYLTRARYPAFPNEQSDIFNAMLNNPQFRNYFINRYADLINTSFSQDNVQQLAYQMRDEIDIDMQRHCTRWNMSYNGWNNEIDNVLNFNSQRINFARNQVQSHFGLQGQVDVELDAYPQGAGKIKISTVTPATLPWTGVYFNGVPVTITAIPNPGYRFDHWEANNTLSSEAANNTITMNISSNDRFVAHFDVADFDFAVYPNPYNTSMQLNYKVPDESTISVRMYSVIGKEIATLIPDRVEAAGDHTITVDLSVYQLSDGIYFLEFRGTDFNKTVRVVKNSRAN